jgi:hypothetical protein
MWFCAGAMKDNFLYFWLVLPVLLFFVVVDYALLNVMPVVEDKEEDGA